MYTNKLCVLSVFLCVFLSACTVTTNQSYTEARPRAVTHHDVVNYGSPYYWVSEPDSYYPQSGYYSPGYQYHYTTARGFWGQ